MSHHRSVPALFASSVTAALLIVGTVAQTAAATPADRGVASVRIKPDATTRGADVAVPHIEGTTLVDGSFRAPIGTALPSFLGRSGTDYVVHARNNRAAGPVVRVTTTGAQRTIVTPTRKGDSPMLSEDGSRLVQSVPQRGFRTTRLTVWDTTDGSVVATKVYPGPVLVLDLDARRVVVGSGSGTTTWTMSSGLVRTLTPRYGYLADVSADRLATFTGDPYDGGCTVVSTLTNPRKTLWKNCDLRVDTFSPDGRRSAAVDLLSDGIGPSVVLVLSNRGAVRSRYDVRGYFGLLSWESPTALLLETAARKHTATVRCTGSTCERASEITPTPSS